MSADVGRYTVLDADASGAVDCCVFSGLPSTAPVQRASVPYVFAVPYVYLLLGEG